MSSLKQIPPRSEVNPADTWNLDSLFRSDQAWETAFEEFGQRIDGYKQFQGTLHDSPERLAECLAFDSQLDRTAERLGVYAFLKTAEDQASSVYQRMAGRFQNVATRAGQLASYIRPEILAMDDQRIADYLAAPALAEYQLVLKRILRYKPHTLSTSEESLLAMQGEMAGAASKIFRQLHDADLKFGSLRNERGEEQELSNATFSQFLHSPDRGVRQAAFEKYYQQFQAHENTLAATLQGSIQKDVYYAKARGYESSLQHALFPDNVPQSVYDNLIQSVRKNLPALHRYYDLRRRLMHLEEIHHYDTYVPILRDLEMENDWDAAVAKVLAALEPLGPEYCQVLTQGLTSRWCDRYPNQGKQSGAFSCGSYDGDPYILMNYKPDILDDIFTLAHEAGHSMHSYLSARHQPFLYYDYTIFVAEVASTFNEQLLSHHLMGRAANDRERAYLINREIDGIRATVFRQTMFAEFEKTTHEMAERGEPLTVEAFKGVYRELLVAYFGPQFTLDDTLSLECFRIPHFYRAFYVYKYATGLAAAIALSQRVLQGGPAELQDYLGFLQGGCSKDPLDLLRDAGVNMEQAEPVDTALARFDQLVSELDQLLSPA